MTALTPFLPHHFLQDSWDRQESLHPRLWTCEESRETRLFERSKSPGWDGSLLSSLSFKRGPPCPFVVHGVKANELVDPKPEDFSRHSWPNFPSNHFVATIAIAAFSAGSLITSPKQPRSQGRVRSHRFIPSQARPPLRCQNKWCSSTKTCRRACLSREPGAQLVKVCQSLTSRSPLYITEWLYNP